MLVTLAEAKSALGIPLTDTSVDVQLTRIITACSVFVAAFTRHRFEVPIRRTEYRYSCGETELILDGHIDESVDANSNPSEIFDPALSLTVETRPHQGQVGDWTLLIPFTDYERRGDRVLYLGAWGFWPDRTDVRFTYDDGYLVPPADLVQAVIEMVINQYAIEKAVAAGGVGITAEKLGDFSYNRDLHAIGAGGYNTLSDMSKLTLLHYKRAIA
jgi:hypothetical protein